MGDSENIDWHGIDTVLLDMDGTLLDLRFDNWFWLELVPAHYAAARGIDTDAARALLTPMFVRIAHTLPWYCIDHWSRELGLDIRALKRQVRHEVRFLPGAEEFLTKLRAMGKRVVMLTNSHPDTLAIKDLQVGITRYFDACYSTHPFGLPKEADGFWVKFSLREEFSRQRALFVDDSLPVLHSAQNFGIVHLRAVRRPDSGAAPKDTHPFLAIDAVAQLIP